MHSSSGRTSERRRSGRLPEADLVVLVARLAGEGARAVRARAAEGTGRGGGGGVQAPLGGSGPSAHQGRWSFLFTPIPAEGLLVNKHFESTNTSTPTGTTGAVYWKNCMKKHTQSPRAFTSMVHLHCAASSNPLGISLDARAT